MNLRIVDVNGNETSLNVKQLLAVDGQPIDNSSGNVIDRMTLLEAHVADLIKFRDAVLEHQPQELSNES